MVWSRVNPRLIWSLEFVTFVKRGPVTSLLNGLAVDIKEVSHEEPTPSYSATGGLPLRMFVNSCESGGAYHLSNRVLLNDGLSGDSHAADGCPRSVQRD